MAALAALLATGFCLIIAFQNFSDPTEDVSALQDIRDLAPTRPDGYFDRAHVLTAPSHATSPESAASQWLERESRPLLAPIEKEWMLTVNRRLDRFFKFEPVKSEDWPESSDDTGPGRGDDGSRGPASDAPPGMPKMPTRPDGSPDVDAFTDQFSFHDLVPHQVRLTKANEVTLGFGHGTDLSCELQNGQSTIVLSRAVSANTSLNLSHNSGENKNSMHFSLSW